MGQPDLAAGHIERFRGRIDDLVDRLHGEIEGHEFDDRAQAVHGGAHRHAGEAVLGDRRIDDALGAETIEQALADFIGALVLRDFLTHQEHGVVGFEFGGHRVAQGFAHGDRFGGAPVAFGCDCGDGLRRGFRGGGGDVPGLRFCRLGFCGRRRRGGAAVGEGRNGCVHRDVFGAFGDEDLVEPAFIDGFDFHGGLVGFDFGDDVAGADIVALAFEPAGELSLGHGGREGGHQNIGHGA